MELHPVQNGKNRGCKISSEVTARAYEVYCHLFGEQEALVTGGCRGGFGALELVAFLYARSFPKNEWQARFDHALRTGDPWQ